MPPKRAAEGDATQQAKKFRQAIDEMAEEFVCPITQELPVDPVTAEDGRVYERSAVEEWLGQQPNEQVKSPITNELMGKKLFPAVQVRNSIKGMVKSGAISGAKADAWKKRMEEEEEVAALRRKAEGGDAEAMECLGSAILLGINGVQRRPQAFTWFKKAADLDDTQALIMCGLMYSEGGGVAKNVGRSIACMAQAAGLGSEHACYWLGSAHLAGNRGLDVDKKETRRWFEKMQRCMPVADSLGDEQRDVAAKWLRENPA